MTDSDTIRRTMKYYLAVNVEQPTANFILMFLFSNS